MSGTALEAKQATRAAGSGLLASSSSIVPSLVAPARVKFKMKTNDFDTKMSFLLRDNRIGNPHDLV